MIRLLAIGAPQMPWREIAPRLRGATLDSDSRRADEITATAACDAVLILPDSSVSTEGIERLIQHGKHVLASVEAIPFNASPSTLLETSHAAKQCLGIVNPDRYLPSRQLIRQQLDAGKLGEPGLVRIHRWDGMDPVAALLCDLDLVHWYFGKPPNRVFAVRQTDAQCQLIHLGFPDGGMALIDHVRTVPGRNRYYYLSVIGSSGAAHADDHQNMQLLFRQDVPRAVRTDEGVAAVAAMIQEFVDAIHAGRDMAATSADWKAVLAARDAVDRSMTTGQAMAMS
ncbi:MAG: hypothetical protein HYX68_19420 [Planctomycetes bacterium]|jgi:predicted dehydrogenase|nr:hypothetical protein [Planctomycetota bacterium]